MDTKHLDLFEQTLETGLVKICRTAGLMDSLLSSPDIDQKWEEFITDYVSDAVKNFNDYPTVAIGFAGFLGMAVAHGWDSCWKETKAKHYKDFYGQRGFDDMDDHIMDEILKLSQVDKMKMSKTLVACAEATLSLIRHQGIEAQTEEGFFTLVRAACVIYRVGASLELDRLGYKKVALDPRKVMS